MMRQIRRLESIARQLEPDQDQRQDMLDQVTAYSQDYLNSIAAAPANVPDDGQWSLYESPISEEGIEIDQALRLIRENVDHSGITTTSGRFMGYIPGGALFPAALGDYLAAVANRYAGYYFASPGAVRVENMLLNWMAQTAGYPETATGNLTSGGSLANLLAIVTARDRHQINSSNIRRSVIYLTHHAHHSNDKAIHMAGLSDCVKRQVAVDERLRMDDAALKRTIEADHSAGLNPFLIIASAGTTNTGAVDPLPAIADLAAEYELWLHCDGAYGGFFNLCPEGQEMLRGMERSDSLVMDPHKTLFLPYGTGALLVRDGATLYASQNWDADYMQDAPDRMEELSPAELSPELTKHFRGLRLWLPLKLFGVAPFRAALSEKIYLARYFHQKLGEIEGFEVGPSPDLSVVTYRYHPQRGDVDLFNERLVKRIQRDGGLFISSTQLNGRFTLRLAISSFRTHLEHIDEALEVLKTTAQQIADEG